MIVKIEDEFGNKYFIHLFIHSWIYQQLNQSMLDNFTEYKEKTILW